MRQVNVLLVSNAFAPVVGGVEKVVAEMARELMRRGHQVGVVTARNPLTLRGHERIDGIPVHRLPFYVYRDSVRSALAMMGGMPIACLQLIRLVRKWRPCVLHVHFVYHNAVCAELVRPLLQRQGVPVLLTFHGGDAPCIPRNYRETHRSESRILDWAARRLLRHADGLTAVSTGLRREVQASVPGDSRDIQVIHNGVDPDLFTLRPEHQEQQPVILGVGRLSYQKGFDVLIEAFARISAQYPDWELHLAGDGELRSELTRQVLARGVGTKVRFLGMLSAEQLIEALHSVSIVALASRWEGFPVAALEAMSCGNALVTTQNPGTHEMVQDGVNGVLVPRESPQALADALVRLVESPALRHALGLEARETVARRFTWSRAVDDYEALYERLASRAAATGHVGRDANLRP